MRPLVMRSSQCYAIEAGSYKRNQSPNDRRYKMKIPVSDNLIKHYLENVYFINGHSCAGKSTAV